MTIYFTEPNGSYTDAIKFSVNYPNADINTQYYLALQSRFNKNLISLTINLLVTNERYSEFAADYTDQLGDWDFSGVWDFSIYADTELIVDGTLKLVNNKTKSLENKDTYVSNNEDGSGYVIYE